LLSLDLGLSIKFGISVDNHLGETKWEARINLEVQEENNEVWEEAPYY